MKRPEVLHTIVYHIRSQKAEHPLRVAIDGIDASGKTTLANELAALLQSQRQLVIRASIDAFHNPSTLRSRQGKLSSEGYYEDSFNYSALKTLLLDPLSTHGSRRYTTQYFDYRTDSTIEIDIHTASESHILLFDGLFLQRPEIRAYWDFVIFVDIPFELALERAIVRDLALFGTDEVVRERYTRRYLPAQQLYFTQCSPQENADLVIDNRDPAAPAIIKPNKNELPTA